MADFDRRQGEVQVVCSLNVFLELHGARAVHRLDVLHDVKHSADVGACFRQLLQFSLGSPWQTILNISRIVFGMRNTDRIRFANAAIEKN